VSEVALAKPQVTAEMEDMGLTRSWDRSWARPARMKTATKRATNGEVAVANGKTKRRDRQKIYVPLMEGEESPETGTSVKEINHNRENTQIQNYLSQAQALLTKQD